MKGQLFALFATTMVGLAGTVVAAEAIRIGNLVDYTGSTAVVGKVYGQAKVYAIAYINKSGGIAGRHVKADTVDYSYVVPRAIAAYKKWTAEDEVVAIQGWGTGDTEALIGSVTDDQIPYFSASYAGALTDPAGRNPTTKKPAPYNFFYGPSYSDGVRGLIQWAAEDWQQRGREGKPKYVHMGDNHPYPKAPKAAGEEYAKELGFQVLPSIRYSLDPADFETECLALKESAADYAFLANTSGSNVSLLRSCKAVGVDAQFMANIWGYDEYVMAAAGEAGDGVVWVMGAANWDADVPGMKLVRKISMMSDPSGAIYRPVHYMRGVCSVFYMAEAMEMASASKGGITGRNIKAAMYRKSDWVPRGLEGVCLPSTWTEDDHRGTTSVFLYRSLIEGEESTIDKIYTAEIPRKEEWIGQ